MAITLKDEKIIDRWSMIIENGQGNANNFIRILKIKEGGEG